LRIKEFEKLWMLVEAERIKKKVEYDIRMIRETWFVNGIENYSLYFDKRLPWEPPNTIFDYFPDDFLLIIDESHMTIPQLRAMAQWDRARKNNLIRYGFRLPSAIDHRPLRFEELETTLQWKDINEIKLDEAAADLDLVSSVHKQVVNEKWKDNDDNSSLINHEARKNNQQETLSRKTKKNVKSIFLSATPAEYELELSDEIVEQIIRPTWLLDPVTFVYPKSGDYEILLDSLPKLLNKKPYLNEFMVTEDKTSDKQHKVNLEEIFWFDNEEEKDSE
jgi:excinuclease UvrABC helicase subunit UvrB